MTTDNRDLQAAIGRLRTAAELVRASQQRVEIDPLTLTVKDVDPRPRAFPTSEEHWDAVNDLADAYLAEHAADDGDDIDARFLLSVGATRDECPSEKWSFHRDDALPIGFWKVDDGWKAMLIQTPQWATCIVRGLKTRGDVRRLMAALNIPLPSRGE